MCTALSLITVNTHVSVVG